MPVETRVETRVVQGRDRATNRGIVSAHRVASIDLITSGSDSVEMRLEAVVVPVGDVDRAKTFYRAAGFVEDLDYASGDAFRVVQFTPPGSAASIVFGVGVTSARSGSVEGLVLGVPDIQAARHALLARGIDISDLFHDEGGVFCRVSPSHRVLGPDPDGRGHATFARFRDPDGNVWIIQGVRHVESRL